MNRKKLLSGAALVGLVAVTMFLSGCASEPDLADLMLQTEELPDAENIMVLDGGELQPGDLAHPLNTGTNENMVVYEFEEAYGLTAISGDAYFVSEYLYRYASSRQAQEQADAFVSMAFDSTGEQLLNTSHIEDPADSDGPVVGRSFSITDEEGLVFYWFVGVQKRTLVLLMIGGAPDDTTRSAFDEIKALMQDTISDAL